MLVVRLYGVGVRGCTSTPAYKFAMTVGMYTVVATAQRIVATHTTTAPTWAQILLPTARNYGSGGGDARLRLRPALLGSFREHDIVSGASGAARLRQLWGVLDTPTTVALCKQSDCHGFGSSVCPALGRFGVRVDS